MLRTVTRFCHTADEAITRHHVPRLRGLEDTRPARPARRPHRVPFARKAWADLQNPDDGAVRFDHDHYLKIWALTEPRIDADFLLLDEAQDTNPVVEQIFTRPTRPRPARDGRRLRPGHLRLARRQRTS